LRGCGTFSRRLDCAASARPSLLSRDRGKHCNGALGTGIFTSPSRPSAQDHARAVQMTPVPFSATSVVHARRFCGLFRRHAATQCHLQTYVRMGSCADYSGVTPQPYNYTGDMSLWQTVPINQASHITCLAALSCGDLRRSDYSGVTRKLKPNKGMWLNGFFSPRSIVCARAPRLIRSARDMLGRRIGLFRPGQERGRVDGIVNMSQISAREDAKSHAATNHWLSERTSRGIGRSC
jgi:hypothetical protein